MMEHAPADYRAELQAFCKAANLDRDAGVVANTFPDTYRSWLGCSSLMVSPKKRHQSDAVRQEPRLLRHRLAGQVRPGHRLSAQGQTRLRLDRLSRSDGLSVGHQRRRAGRGRPRSLLVGRRRDDAQHEGDALRRLLPPHPRRVRQRRRGRETPPLRRAIDAAEPGGLRPAGLRRAGNDAEDRGHPPRPRTASAPAPTISAPRSWRCSPGAAAITNWPRARRSRRSAFATWPKSSTRSIRAG